jgi:hypothetical protein
MASGTERADYHVPLQYRSIEDAQFNLSVSCVASCALPGGPHRYYVRIRVFRQTQPAGTYRRKHLFHDYHLTAVLAHKHGGNHDQTFDNHLRVLVYPKQIEPVI